MMRGGHDYASYATEQREYNKGRKLTNDNATRALSTMQSAVATGE